MKNKVTLIIALCLLILVYNSTYAQTYLNQDNDGQAYTVQSNDWLSKLADKFYGNIHAWPHIWIATNKKAIGDSTYLIITNPDFIEVGQKLWIPHPFEVEQVTLGNNELKASILIDAGQGWQTTGLFINENIYKTTICVLNETNCNIFFKRYFFNVSGSYFIEITSNFIVLLEVRPAEKL